MDCVADVFGFGTHFDGESDFSQEVACVDADDRSANDAVCVFVEDEFSEAFSASDAYGATAGNPGNLATPMLSPFALASVSVIPIQAISGLV